MNRGDSLLPRNPVNWRPKNYPPGNPLVESELLHYGTCPHWEKIRAGLVLIGEDADKWIRREPYCGVNWQMDEEAGECGPVCACVQVAKKLAEQIAFAERAIKFPIPLDRKGNMAPKIKCAPDEFAGVANQIQQSISGSKVLKCWRGLVGEDKTDLGAFNHACWIFDTLQEEVLGCSDMKIFFGAIMSGKPTEKGCPLAPEHHSSAIHY